MCFFYGQLTMYEITRQTREIFRTARTDGSTESLGRDAKVKVPGRPCSSHLHSGPIVRLLEDYVLTEAERLQLIQNSDLSGGVSDLLPRRQDLRTVVYQETV